MTGPLKTKSLFILVCILVGFLFQTPQVCRAGFVEKFEPVWEQKLPEPKPAMTRPAPGKKFTNNLGMKFVYIPPERFMMGSPSNEAERDKDEKQHQVTLTKGYYMQTTEVTQGQWERVMGSNPSYFKNCGSNCPVEKVSWEDCQKFIQKLNGMEGTRKYRLPTEAEWEYAARAGTDTPFSFGRCLSTDQANYDGNYPYPGCSKGEYRKSPVAAGSFPHNAWGLYDMHGNVWEWCQDWKGDYPSGSVTDPTGPSSGSNRVGRGGGWNIRARICRAAGRFRITPGRRSISLGFRLAFSAAHRASGGCRPADPEKILSSLSAGQKVVFRVGAGSGVG